MHKCVFKQGFIFSLMALHSTAYASDLTDMSLEQLGSLEITSVSKKSQKLNEVAAAVFIIQQEDIKRSGATTIADVLKMAPGLDVAKINGNRWSISIRGNGGRFSNKLLVLIDGRSVYTPAFSGVYWEATDTNINDIERIEIIRGPGGTIWGANAVNGVINIITKKAQNTQGWLAEVGTGDYEQAFANVRYGHEMLDHGAMRFFIKYFDRGDTKDLFEQNANDSWHQYRAGLRYDYDKDDQKFTLSSEYYNGKINIYETLVDIVPPYRKDLLGKSDVSGWFVLGNYQDAINEKASYTLQVYYDNTKRNEIIGNQRHDTIDIDFNFRYILNSKNDLMFGFGYRHVADNIDTSQYVGLTHFERHANLYSAFVQDEITLTPEKLKLIIGSKFEENDYSGFEIQPSVRMSYLRDNNMVIWGGVSRAVRTPSRLEHDSILFTNVLPPAFPGFPITQIKMYGNPDYEAESLVAYEMGLRYPFGDNFNLDVAIFYHGYDDMRSIEFEPVIILPGEIIQPVVFRNRSMQRTYGAEVVLDYKPLDKWKLQTVYSFANDKTTFEAGSNDPNVFASNNNTPKHRASVRSLYTVHQYYDIDIWVKYVDGVRSRGYNSFYAQAVDTYVTADVRLAWRPNKHLELAFITQNLLNDKHLEGIEEYFSRPSLHQRQYYIDLKYKHK